MRSSYGHNIKYTLFGESHGNSIGIIIDGIPAGAMFDFAEINKQLKLRQGEFEFNTARQEDIHYDITAGFFNNRTTGTPLVVEFKNSKTESKDYRHLINHPRPGHADFVLKMKHNGYNDYRGGGQSSGRMTAPLVFLGEVARQLLQKRVPNCTVVTHIHKLQDLTDFDYYSIRKNLYSKYSDDLFEFKDKLHNIFKASIKENSFPTLNSKMSKAMIAKIKHIQRDGDTIGGQLETVVLNPPAFIGEPFFSSVESEISKLIYSIPSVKGISFGYGEDFINVTGVEVKDEIILANNTSFFTKYNYNGGINGGVTNGEDIVFKTIIKPISSLMQKQMSFNTESKQIQSLDIKGRHDCTIINRVVPIINSLVYVALYDLYIESQK